MNFRFRWTALAVLASTQVPATGALAGDQAYDSAAIARGKYLVTITGCNDCHTSGYIQQGGAVPEKDWLTGTSIGYQGPWGTTYPANLRVVIASMSEAQWLKHARQERLPPMPWFNLREMSDADLKAVYAFVRSLGSAGVAAPAYVAPGGQVNTPFIVFVPVTAPQKAAALR